METHCEHVDSFSDWPPPQVMEGARAVRERERERQREGDREREKSGHTIELEIKGDTEKV